MSSLKKKIKEYEGAQSFNPKSPSYNYFKQYIIYHKKYGDKMCLLFQVGTFYENYGFKDNGKTYGNYEDIARVANYKIANYDKSSSITNPHFVGFPQKSIDKHLDVLISRGYTVIFFDQQYDPDFPNRTLKEDAKYVRLFSRIVSPGTYIDNRDLYTSHQDDNNVACLFFDGIGKNATLDNNLFH